MVKGGSKRVVTVDPDLKEIVPRFLEIRQENIRDISEALKDENYEAISRVGHSMKGSGAGYGFDYITEIGLAIEEGAKRRDAAGIAGWLTKLAHYLDNIEIVYEE